SVPQEESKEAAPAPGKQSSLGGRGDRNSLAGFAGRRGNLLTAARRDDPAAAVAGASGGFSLKDTRRVVLPNGLVLLLWENHRLPIVVASANVAQISLREKAEQAGLATLMGALLDEGTTKHTGPEIAEMIENVGGSLSLSSSGGS